MRIVKTKNVILIICVSILFWNCNKSSQSANSTTPPGLTISSINPTHGPIGAAITIIGTGFLSSGSIDSVLINGRRISITNITATQISVTIPRLIGSGNVNVYRGGNSYNGPTFTYDTTVTVSTIAGNGTAGSADGIGTAATFENPSGIVIDKFGNLFVADNVNYTIRKIDQNGNVSLFAGSPGLKGYTDATGTAARFGEIFGLTIDSSNNLYVCDLMLDRIRKITPNAVVTTFAGTGIGGSVDGPLATARFDEPEGLKIDQLNNFFVADSHASQIREISSSGQVSTIAGNGTFGSVNGPALSSSFYNPSDVVVDNNGVVYVVDNQNNQIRKVSGGTVSTFAGTTLPGNQDGLGSAAHFYSPTSAVIDKQGNLFVVDAGNISVRKISPDGYVRKYAGGGIGDIDGPVPFASFRRIYGITIDQYGNLYVTDQLNHKIRKISID